MKAFGSILLYIAFILLYWAPTIIATIRRVQGIGQVVVVNFFTWFLFFPWVIALTMAFRHVPKASQTQ